MRFTLPLRFIVALLPLRKARAQTEAPFPEMNQVRAWIAAKHPMVLSGERGLENAAIIVTDTAGRYVRSVAYRLTAVELSDLRDAAGRAAAFEDDATSKNLMNACFAGDEKPKIPHPLCLLDGASRQEIDALRLLATRDVDVLQPDAAKQRFGATGANGAVIATTDSAQLARFTTLGATPANFVAFEQRRVRRQTDGLPLLITVLMLRI